MAYPINPIESGLYALSGRRQNRSMTYLCDIYGLPPLNDSPVPIWDGTQGSPDGNYIKLYTLVPCAKQATKEYDQAGVAGSGEEINLQTLDDFLFHSAQPLMDRQIIQVTTTPDGSNASTNLWWTVMGNAQAFDWRAQTSRYVAKRLLDPPSFFKKAGQ